MTGWRIQAVIIVIFLIGSGILARLFSIQILQYDYYYAFAQDQHQLYEKLFPKRGEIYIHDLSANTRTEENPYSPLAVNREFYQVYLVPRDIKQEDKSGLADRLSSLLEVKKEIILERMDKSDDPYEPLKHKISDETANEIRKIDIKGVGLAPETWRYYPHEELGCHLTGFVGITENGKMGQYGLEGYYEETLKGESGFLSGQKDTSGNWIPSLIQKIDSAEDGSDLVLTIDQNIQFRAEKELKSLVEKWQPENGTIIIMEPKTGAVRAMANYPCFNPNEYNKVEDIDVFLNPAIHKVYEPGSVFKPITIAAGLDSNKISSQTTYNDSGQTVIRETIIRNSDNNTYGEQTMTEVLEKSINTGAVFVQQTIGQKIFSDYIEKFYFHIPTGIDLASETVGDISNLYTGREINLATISFGQGVTVTPMGMLSALSAIANQGRMMRPYIVDKIVKPEGEEIKTEPQLINQVISKESSEELSQMLVSVTENGFGKPVRISGYSIASKTGTAQIPDFEKGGYTDQTAQTLIGFAPAFDPKFAILIKLEKPQGVRFASVSISPAFKSLTEYLLNYFEIPPQ